LAIGRLHPQKGFDILLEAIPPLLEAHADLHLLIAGEGPQKRELEERVAGSACGSRIHLVGRRDDVPSLLQACDVFVLSSRWEGMPNVVLEAMAAGLPVVATDVEGVRDVVIDGETGIIAEQGSAVSLSNAMKSLLTSQHGPEMGIAGQEHVRSYFQWHSAVGKYDLLYRRLLSATGCPSDHSSSAPSTIDG
jgi:starch synthase (maltosyl-transferring)